MWLFFAGLVRGGEDEVGLSGLCTVWVVLSVDCAGCGLEMNGSFNLRCLDLVCCVKFKNIRS